MVWAAKYEVAPVPLFELWIDLDQVEAHYPGAVGQGDEGLFELAVRHAVRLGGDASAYERRVQDVNVQADIPTRALGEEHGHPGWPTGTEIRHGHCLAAVVVSDPVIAHLPFEVATPCAGVEVAIGEPQRVFPDRPGAKARSRHEGRALVGWGTEDHQVGLGRVFGPAPGSGGRSGCR